MEKLIIVEMSYSEFYEEYPYLAEVIAFERQTDMDILMIENPVLRVVIREKTGTMLFYQLQTEQEWQIPMPTDEDCEARLNHLFMFGIESEMTV